MGILPFGHVIFKVFHDLWGTLYIHLHKVIYSCIRLHIVAYDYKRYDTLAYIHTLAHVNISSNKHFLLTRTFEVISDLFAFEQFRIRCSTIYCGQCQNFTVLAEV